MSSDYEVIDGVKYKVLTAQEMLDLRRGEEVVNFNNGRVMLRHFIDLDDLRSCGFIYPDDERWGFYSEGEVGLKAKEDSPLTSFNPALDKRKDGKVLMHLLDQGFPNAMLELAKVLTWAGEHKGYLPHDWQNVPDPENTFQGAAGRHRVKSLIQKSQGLSASERVDEESGLVHKVHEAFNIMAELELILTKKIN